MYKFNLKKVITTIFVFTVFTIHAAEVTGNINTNNVTQNTLSGSILSNGNGTITISAGDKNVTIAPGSNAPISLSIPAGVTNATLDFSALMSGGVINIPSNINAVSNLDGVQMTIDIPAGAAMVVASSSWNGKITLPTTVVNSIAPIIPGGSTLTQVSIEMGVQDAEVTFTKAVRILLTGAGDKRPGYVRAGVFVAVDSQCAVDSRAWVDNIANVPTGKECYIISGADMILWTKHFTIFEFYKFISSGSGGGGGGASYSGGGGGGSLIPIIGNYNYVSTNTVSNTSALGNAYTENSHKDYKFKPFTLKLKLKSEGPEVLQLQNFLISKSFMISTVPTGYFGNVTANALKQYQKDKGLEPTGAVGPATLKALNFDISTTKIVDTKIKTIATSTDIKNKTLNTKLDFKGIKKLDDEDESIKLIQKALQKKGYLYTKATGYFGVSTERAIKELQKDSGLKVTGVYDKETAENLNK